MKRATTYTVCAWLLAVVGLLLAAVGASFALAFGPDSQMHSEPSAISGPGAALLVDDVRVDASNLAIPAGIGTVTLVVRPVGPRAIFVGAAAPADLDGYLTAVPYDVVRDLEPGAAATVRSVPGSKLPPPPAQQTFWLAQVSGAPGKSVMLTADLHEGTSLVVMNAVPGNGVQADLSVRLTVPWAWTAAISLLAAGAVLLLLVAPLLGWRGRVARRRSGGGRHGTGAARAAVLPGEDVVLGDTVLPAGPDDPTQQLPAVRLPPPAPPAAPQPSSPAAAEATDEPQPPTGG